MKPQSVLGMLLFSVLPVMAAPQPVIGTLVFTANPISAFEAGQEKVEGAAGDAVFLRAKTEGDTVHQAAELALELPGDAYHDKRLRLSTRLKVQAMDRAGCSLEARGDDGKPLVTLHGDYRSGTGGWRDCSVVMQIPVNAASLHLKLIMRGNGTVWSDGFTIEEVGGDIPVTPRFDPP